jgi:hypothetical protein
MQASAVFTFLISSFVLSAGTAWMPLTDWELGKRFRVRLIEKELYCPPPQLPPYSRKIGGIHVYLGGPRERLRFSGRDVNGKPWVVHASPHMAGSLYQADLDRAGQADLIYASLTGGVGMSPNAHILFLLRDRDQRPVALEMEGYFNFDAKGLAELLDLDGDGRAELVRQDYDDGYWVTSLYEFRANRAHRIQGDHGGRIFPLYTRFTNQGNRTPVTPKPHRHPRESNLSNQIGDAEFVRLSKLTFESRSNLVEFEATNGHSYCVNTKRGTATVSIDAGSSRRSATVGVQDQTNPLLKRIVRDKLPVLVSGRRYERGVPGEGCVESIWALDSR